MKKPSEQEKVYHSVVDQLNDVATRLEGELAAAYQRGLGDGRAARQKELEAELSWVKRNLGLGGRRPTRK